MADGTSSSYAFWIRNNDKNLTEELLFAFRSEGGVHIVSTKIKELFEILTVDVEPSYWLGRSIFL